MSPDNRDKRRVNEIQAVRYKGDPLEQAYLKEAMAAASPQ